MRVLIIGGGIGGLCLAQGLRKAGIDVAVFERQSTATDGLAGYGIHIDANGRQALRHCLQPADFAHFEKISTTAGTQLYFRDTNLRLLLEKDDAVLSGKSIEDIERRGIGRLELRDILSSGLDSSTIHWNKTFTQYENLQDGRVRAHFADGTIAEGDLLVGAEGSHSKVREQYLPRVQREELGIVAIAGRYVLNGQRVRELPMSFTNGSLNNIVPSGEGWMFLSAWRSRPPARNEEQPSAEEHYLLWAYVVPKSKTPADIQRVTSCELQDIALNGISNWSPILSKLVRQSSPDTISSVRLRSMPRLEPWQSSNVTLIGDAIHVSLTINLGSNVPFAY